MPAAKSRVREVEMFDMDDPKAGELFARVTQNVIDNKRRLIADRARVARISRLLR